MGDIPDRMSALPDDILIAIISRLTLIEATATSILSHRWRYLHTYVTRLEFPPFASEFPESTNDDLLIESERIRFCNHVKMIDGVLDSHRGGGVKEMKMHMHRMKGASVEKWVEFAFTKQIEIIDISLQVTPIGLIISGGCRYSPGLSKFISGTRHMKFLKQLSFDGIDMNEQDFELLFSKSNFVALESVSVRGVRDLKQVSIVGHPKLKHVDIRFISTPMVESFEIRDVTNLVSLCFDNLFVGCAVELENIPKLTEFYYGDGYYRSNLVYDVLLAGMSSCILDQLQLLHISTIDLVRYTLWPGPLPFKLVNIKHMELEVKRMREPTSLYRLKPLIRACPSLQNLKIKFDWCLYFGVDSIELGERKVDVYYPNLEKLCPNLKELEMEGYAGSQSEFELASYIIICAVNLERVFVVPCDATKDIQRETTARAKLDFQKISPPPRLHVKFK